MTAPLRIAGQALVWLGFVALIGLFAQWPRLSPLPPEYGELRLSLAHLTERMQPCRTLSEEERMALPPNMRVTERCERARAPARIELRLDERVLHADEVQPAGLHREGRAYLYARWALPSGAYRLRVALRDTPREDGFDLEREFELHLRAGRSALLEIGDGAATLYDGAAEDGA